ncbi:MAG: hypothetical protein LC723_01955, partial [Actinobacteria bacterium]|nr:hypothetical protein [Actinomycetota bacterium]
LAVGADRCRIAPAGSIAFGGSIECHSQPIADDEVIPRAVVSITLLRPDEYRRLCHEKPPPGQWVVAARTNTGLIGFGAIWDPDWMFNTQDPKAKARDVVAGLTVGSTVPSAGSLDQATIRVSEPKGCFPKGRQSLNVTTN